MLHTVDRLLSTASLGSFVGGTSSQIPRTPQPSFACFHSRISLAPRRARAHRSDDGCELEPEDVQVVRAAVQQIENATASAFDPLVDPPQLAAPPDVIDDVIATVTGDTFHYQASQHP